MQWFKLGVISLGAAVLIACGGGGNGDQSPKIAYSSLVTFGDSLSDIGTYKVGTIAALHGGKYTINSSTDKNWTELIATQLGLAAPCPAQTGLDGTAAYGFSVAPTNFTNCRNYAQGGARVTNPVGPGHKLTGSALGQLTVPISTQISNHLAVVNNAFSGKELVTVMAGGNDVFMNLAIFNATVAAGGDPTTAATTAATAMAQAAVELSGYVKTQILAKGATRVIVLNIPDIANTPFGNSLSAQGKGFVDTLVTTFNRQLSTSLTATAGVLLIDAYASSKDEVVNPGAYGLSNVTATACNLSYPTNGLATATDAGSSLVCTPSNVIAGDTSKYLFADTVHPTPYGYKLTAQLIAKEMVLAGWL